MASLQPQIPLVPLSAALCFQGFSSHKQGEEGLFLVLGSCPVLPFLLLATVPLLSSRSASAAPPRQRGIMLGTPFSGRRLYQEDRLGASQEDHLPHHHSLGMQCGLPGILPCRVTMPWTGGLLLLSECRLISHAVLLHKTHSDSYSKN